MSRQYTTDLRLRPKDMKLGDRVKIDNMDEWNTCIVKSIDADHVTLFRPYGTTSGFEDTSGVFCYIGIEEFKLYRHAATWYTVTSREDLK